MLNKVITAGHCWHEIGEKVVNAAKLVDNEIVISVKAEIARAKLPALRQQVRPAFAEHLGSGYLIAPVIRAEAVRYVADTMSATSTATL